MLIQMYCPCHMTSQPGSPNGKTAPAMLWLHEIKWTLPC